MTLEVCAGSIESIRAAYEGGADRVEVCSALSEDGLTPSVGMIRYARSLEGLKVHVLIRPRGGDFVYTEAEVQCMIDDIRMACQMGVDGVVIGALTRDGNIDVDTCRRLIEATEGKVSVTFHRAFDVCRDMDEALEQIVELGCDRLLTSGHAKNVDEGVGALQKIVANCGRAAIQGGKRLIIMPGCGVNPENAARILQVSGATEIHASARSTRQFGRLETDPEIVSQIKKNIETVRLKTSDKDKI